MGAYIPALVWVFFGYICWVIARKRGVKLTFLWTILIVFLGPFAVPLMFIAPVSKEKTEA